jgi:hypothetical protein
MTGAGWLCVGTAVLAAIAYVYHVAYGRGYAAGQFKERRAIARVLNEERRRACAAERDIDYLFERARWQFTSQGSASAQSDADHTYE